MLCSGVLSWRVLVNKERHTLLGSCHFIQSFFEKTQLRPFSSAVPSHSLLAVLASSAIITVLSEVRGRGVRVCEVCMCGGVHVEVCMCGGVYVEVCVCRGVHVEVCMCGGVPV